MHSMDDMSCSPVTHLTPNPRIHKRARGRVHATNQALLGSFTCPWLWKEGLFTVSTCQTLPTIKDELAHLAPGPPPHPKTQQLCPPLNPTYPIPPNQYLPPNTNTRKQTCTQNNKQSRPSRPTSALSVSTMTLSSPRILNMDLGMGDGGEQV